MTFTEDDEDAYVVRRDELVSDFDAWAHTTGIADFAGAEDFGTLLDWKWGYADGRLDTWRLGDIEEFLLEWCPRKIAAPAELVEGIPSTVTLGMSFLATHELLSSRSDPLERLTEFTMGLQGRFMEAMDNPANFGMGKSLLGGLGIDDLSSMDPGELENAIEAFNALPQEERLRLTGGADNAAPLPTIGPILMPEEAAVRESAGEAPVLSKFEQLNDYFASPGRPLTAAGNLKLADAHALTELLETGDIAEQEIGDKIWRKRQRDPIRTARPLAVVGARGRCASASRQQAGRRQGLAATLGQGPSRSGDARVPGTPRLRCARLIQTVVPHASHTGPGRIGRAADGTTAQCPRTG